MSSADSIFPQALHCAVRVLFSFALSLGMCGHPARRHRGLCAKSLLGRFDHHGHSGINTDAQVNRHHVLAD